MGCCTDGELVTVTPDTSTRDAVALMRKHRIGALKKSIQSGVHVFSSDKFTVMMTLQRRNDDANGGSVQTLHTGHTDIQR